MSKASLAHIQGETNKEHLAKQLTKVIAELDRYLVQTMSINARSLASQALYSWSLVMAGTCNAR